MVKYRYLILYFQQKCCCPLFILQTSTTTKEKKGKKKDKRKRLNGWCPLEHNDKLWYNIKMPPLLLRKSAQVTLQLRQQDLSSRIFFPTHTQLVCSTARA